MKSGKLLKENAVLIDSMYSILNIHDFLCKEYSKYIAYVSLCICQGFQYYLICVQILCKHDLNVEKDLMVL